MIVQRRFFQVKFSWRIGFGGGDCCSWVVRVEVRVEIEVEVDFLW